MTDRQARVVGIGVLALATAVGGLAPKLNDLTHAHPAPGVECGRPWWAPWRDATCTALGGRVQVRL